MSTDKQLRFRQDGTFKIVQFTDVHHTSDGSNSIPTFELMEEVLAKETPDLVVFTGDLIASHGDPSPKDAIQEVTAVAQRAGIPFAVVLGNHDAEGIVPREEMITLFEGSPFSLTESGPDDISGYGNYVLTVQGSGSEQPGAALYFVDSGDYAPSHIGGYDWIKRDQIEWYVHQSTALTEQNSGKPLPSLAFFHIPVPEYDEVWNSHTCSGLRYEEVCSPKINSGFFTALVEMGDVMGTFVGHDHVNDYEGKLHGIRLCYGRATGYNTYGRDGFPRGARIIQLQEGQRAFDSWLRLADGTVVKEQPQHLPAGRVLSEA